MTDATPTPPPPPPRRRPTPGWGPKGKVREPIAVAIFSIITLGIYFLVWTYKIFKENKEFSGDGVGGVIGLVIGIVIGIVNWFLHPVGDRQHLREDGPREARPRRDRLLEPDPDRRLLHLGLQGPGRDDATTRLYDTVDRRVRRRVADYPVNLEFDRDYDVQNWRPLVNWLLAIPQWIVLYILGIVAFVLWFVSLFVVAVHGAEPLPRVPDDVPPLLLASLELRRIHAQRVPAVRLRDRRRRRGVRRGGGDGRRPG